MKRTPRSLAPLWIALAWLCVRPAGAASGSAGGAFTLLSSNSGELRFSFEGRPAGAVRLSDGTVVFSDLLHAEGPLRSRLYVPGAATWIATPPEGETRLAVSLDEVTPMEWPEGTTEAERSEILEALGTQAWSSSGDCWTARQHGRAFRLCPVIPDGTGGLAYVRRATITARFFPREGGAGEARPAQDPLESYYRDQFINYQQGKAWRGRPFSPDAPRRARAGDYFSSTPNPWIKVHVPRRAYYEIRGEDLRALGLDLEGIDPASLRLFAPLSYPLREDLDVDQAPAWMEEVPIEVLGGGDGTFTATDAIRFVGQGPDGWFDDLGVPATPQERYYRDLYNNDDVYWLTWGGEFTENPQPLRIPVEDRTQIFEPYLGEVRDRIHLEEDLLWDPRPRDIYGPEDQYAEWEKYFWLFLRANVTDQAQVLRVSLEDPSTTHSARMRLRFWGNSYNRSQRPWSDHTLQVFFNGNRIAEQSWGGFGHVDIVADTTGLVSGEQEFQFLLPAHPAAPYADSTRFDQVYLSWIELDYWRRLVARGDTLSFFAGGLSGAQTLELNGFAHDDVVLLDTSDPRAPVRLLPQISQGEGSAYRARFRVSLDEEHPGRFLACTGAGVGRPKLEIDPEPEGGYLRERTAAVQGLVVTHGDFTAAARRLADYRRDHFPDRSHASVEVVQISDIMDEFSFGRSDPTALRNFLEWARENWTGGDANQGPAYVVLLGDAHYDYRDLLGRGAVSYVPTWENNYDRYLITEIYSPQFATDDYFAYLDGPGDTGMDIFVGRLPARSSLQANTMVDKVLSYADEAGAAPWRARVTLVADDVCQGTHSDRLGFLHMKQTEELTRRIPSSIQQDKVYLYEYGSECLYDRKPDAAEALKTRIEDGTLLVNFTGHGSEQQLADERVLETADVAGMNNADRLFLFFTASCSVGKYDFFGEGLGESLMLHSGGGAVAIFSAAAIAYSTGNAELNQRFFETLFPDSVGGRTRALGQAAAMAKARLVQPGNLNSKRYILLADPALKLASPTRQISLSLTDARSQAALGDSLVRGMLTDLSGQVTDETGQPAYGFNGTASVRIYDSGILRKPDPSDTTMKYTLTGAPIYRGEAAVRDGAFHLRFQTPAALAIGTGGKAQIYTYAEDPQLDAAGALPAISVAERTQSGQDREGPVITLKIDGDPTAVLPGARFRATLEDSSGINVTGLLRSRSVAFHLEEEGRMVVPAQDVSSAVYFPAAYDSAALDVPLPADLAAGHTYDLVLRASDNMRNGSSARVSFTMSGAVAGAFQLGGVFSFPNPASGAAGFFGDLSETADVEVEIFTVAGRSLWRLPGPVRVSPAEFAQRGIPWDGRDLDGDALANGVYLYKVTARPAGGGPALTRIERLVIYR